MTLVTHLLGGFTSIAILDTILPSFTAEKSHFIVASISSALPDIDYTRSFVGRLLYPISRPIESMVGHRTATHSILVAVIISALAGVSLNFFMPTSPLQWAVVFFCGYISHIILDWLTKEGCQSYWPSTVWCILPRNRSWRIRTGKGGEVFIFLIILTACSVSFQPSRDAVAIWFRTSFITEKSEELHRFELRRNHVSRGFNRHQIDSLLTNGIITPIEHQEMVYEIDQININERISRRMFGLPVED